MRLLDYGSDDACWHRICLSVRSESVRWKKAIPWLAIAAFAGVVLFLNGGSNRPTESDQSADQSAASGQQDQEQHPTKSKTMADLLDDCSPFESFDGVRTLEFDAAAHTVMLNEAVGDERTKGALFAEHPQVTQGTWTADETRTVVLDFASIPTTYILVIPPSGMQCILARGTTDAVNLQTSWFGSLPENSGSSND